MGNENQNISRGERMSNSAVLDKSLDSKNQVLIKSSSDSGFNIQEDFKNIKLPIENDMIESEELLLDANEEEIKTNFFLDKEDDLSLINSNHSFRSKSCICNHNINLYNAPKQKLKIFDEQISPLKLSANFGHHKHKIRKSNSYKKDLEKTTIDSKSCNENQFNKDDYFEEENSDSDIEITIPKLEDIQNLKICRKKMTIFSDSLDNKSEHSLNENNKIDYIFENKIIINKQKKKNKFWNKYIKKQILKSKLSNKLRISDRPIKKAITVREKDIKYQNEDLFILGILESAAKDKKLKKMARNTSNI